jgi:hypothetical protein
MGLDCTMDSYGQVPDSLPGTKGCIQRFKGYKTVAKLRFI